MLLYAPAAEAIAPSTRLPVFLWSALYQLRYFSPETFAGSTEVRLLAVQPLIPVWMAPILPMRLKL